MERFCIFVCQKNIQNFLKMKTSIYALCEPASEVIRYVINLYC